MKTRQNLRTMLMMLAVLAVARSGVARRRAGVVGRVVADQAYGDHPLQKLDVYPVPGEAKPVVIFVHGGGWRGGDKLKLQSVPAFARFFADRGLLLVAPNYRLMPEVGNDAQAADVAASVAWVRDNAARFGGDAGKIVLWGYSAGAQLVALVGADSRYLAAHDLSPADLAGIAAYDVNAYDIPRGIATAPKLNYPRAARNLPRFFSPDPSTQRALSAVNHLDPAAPLPPFLLVWASIQKAGWGTRRQRLSEDQANHFATAIRKVGGRVRVEGFEGSHGALVLRWGSPGHGPTKWLESFLSEVSGVRDQ